MSSSGILNCTHSTLTAAPSIAGMFDTITDLFLYATTHQIVQMQPEYEGFKGVYSFSLKTVSAQRSVT